MGEYIVELKAVDKFFPGVKALQNVDFNLKTGEVLALLGENGAGKSTLMKILSGVYKKDGGSMKIYSEEVENMTPQKAKKLGIAIIHQELNMCSHLSVVENIFLGKEITKNGLLCEREMREKAQNILDSLNVDISVDTVVGDLSVSKQQMVEIAKALSENAKILIMDEPTSALTGREIRELFKIINNLKEQGHSIVYISHRLEELEHIVDRVMILRDGQYVATMDYKDTDLDSIISLMVGREIKEKFPRIDTKRGKKIMEVKNLTTHTGVKDVSFSVYEGEIIGIAGLVGAGRTETTRALFGADPKISGEIYINDEKVTINSPRDSIKAGLVLVPEDRKKDGLCTKLSVKDNISLPNLDILSSAMGVINNKKENELSKNTIDNLNIKVADINSDAEGLSGGNQQKVVVGKWLASNSKITIFDEPTRGIDVAAKVEIYNLMNDLKSQGIGVVFVSSEMPEILGMSDRILVMADGKITKELDISEATQDTILKYATKFESKI